MRKKQWLLDYMRSLHDLLEFYLENPFDEDTHMQLNDGLTDTFDAMHSYFMDRDISHGSWCSPFKRAPYKNITIKIEICF